MNQKQILIVIAIIFIIFIFVFFSQERQNAHLTKPKPKLKLSDNYVELTAIWIRFACDCPRWVNYEYYLKNSISDIDCSKNENCFEVEAKDERLKIPEEFFKDDQVLFKLSGRFYVEKIVKKENAYSTEVNLFQYEQYERLELE